MSYTVCKWEYYKYSSSVRHTEYTIPTMWKLIDHLESSISPMCSGHEFDAYRLMLQTSKDVAHSKALARKAHADGGGYVFSSSNHTNLPFDTFENQVIFQVGFDEKEIPCFDLPLSY